MCRAPNEQKLFAWKHMSCVAMAYMSIVQAILAMFGLLIWRLCVLTWPRSNLPPGPKGIPILGNIMQLPRRGVPEFQHWIKFKDKYGPISSVTIMGQTIIIIHDKQTAYDLLEAQSRKTSARPRFEFGCTMCGFDDFLPLRQYDDEFRRQRQLIVRQLGNASAFNEIQEAEACRFILRVWNRPENLVKHFQIATSAVFLKAVYGYTIQRDQTDPLIELTERVVANVEKALVPLAWAVDLVPPLKYLPTRFPGMAFKRTAHRWRKMTQSLADIPYMFVQRQMEKGHHQSSFVSSLIEQHTTKQPKLAAVDEYAIKWAAATLFAGGAENTVSTLSNIVLAMVVFPEVQRKAQAEIDRVTAGARLPRLADREKLLYIEALVKEAYRWNPLAPMGLAHVSEEDLSYKNFLIPKGAFLLPAVWWFCHDPGVYTSPFTFDPGRYLEPRNEPDPREVIFGFGRRVCPGRFFAHSLLFVTAAQTLAVFNITKAIDEKGLEIDVNLEYGTGIANRPQEFRYQVAPRSALQIDLIRNAMVKEPVEEDTANVLEDDGELLNMEDAYLGSHARKVDLAATGSIIADIEDDGVELYGLDFEHSYFWEPFALGRNVATEIAV